MSSLSLSASLPIMTTNHERTPPYHLKHPLHHQSCCLTAQQCRQGQGDVFFCNLEMMYKIIVSNFEGCSVSHNKAKQQSTP
jgi:hypothetical protein